jgi:hypothetical protein
LLINFGIKRKVGFMMKFKFFKSLAFIVALFIGVTAINVIAQDDAELIKTANDFSQAFKLADDKKMEVFLSDDFQYFTNVPCPYKDCEKGTGKENYIKGVIAERKERGFTIESVMMKYVKPIINTNISQTERKVSFNCGIVMKAEGKKYIFNSFINYYFRKDGETWKIIKIENQLLDRVKEAF